jgi:glutaminyl-tRNA synthetase
MLLYNFRFKHKNPEDPVEVPGGFVTDCNRDSLKILESFADKTLKSAKIFDKFQFERNGFFSVDPDTSAEKVCVKRVLVNINHLI